MAVDLVEESWHLIVAYPDPDSQSPQIGTTFTPSHSDLSKYVLFNLNYRDYPVFQAGGLQTKVWSNNAVVAYSSFGSALFQTSYESISWIQQVSVSGGNINYKILSGQSDTWGQFGSGLSVAFPTSLTSLSGYNPNDSKIHSNVSYGSTDVSCMVLAQVKYFQQGVLLSIDSTPRYVISP